jgi:hypothetical protein
MLSLRETHLQMRAAITGNEPSVAPRLFASGNIPAASRIAVYRNNAREGARKALAATFPVVERLVGATCFRQLAWDYACRRPSQSGNLDFFGNRFPEYLLERFGTTQHAYLSEVARLEWLLHALRFVPLRALPAIGLLAEADTDRLGGLRVVPSPACRLLHSEYPVLTIWRANQDRDREPDLIDLSAGGERVLLRRAPAGTILVDLEHGEFHFFRLVRRGLTLAEAAAGALCKYPQLAIDRALYRMFDLGVAARLVLPESLRTPECNAETGGRVS